MSAEKKWLKWLEQFEAENGPGASPAEAEVALALIQSGEEPQTKVQSPEAPMSTNHVPALLAAASRIQALAAKGKCEGVEIEGWKVPPLADGLWHGPGGRTDDEATPYDTAAIAWCLWVWVEESSGTYVAHGNTHDGGRWMVGDDDYLDPIKALLAALDAEIARLEGE